VPKGVAMFGSTILDTVIGVVFVFLILSVLASSAREIIEGWLQTRAVHLERGIRELLSDPHGEGLATQLFDHPLVSSLYTGEYEPRSKLTARTFKRKDAHKRYHFRSNLPAYIPAANFAHALVDIALRGSPAEKYAGHTPDLDTAPLTAEKLRENICKIENTQVKRGLLLAFDQARGDLDHAIANVEHWFDSGMDRVSGRYRKETQWILLGIGLAMAVILNVDAIRLGSHLYTNDSARAVVVAEAQTLSRDGAAAADYLNCPKISHRDAVSCQQAKLERLGLPIGWPLAAPSSGSEWRAALLATAWSIPGWLLTALAITMGAPFWFDVLNKFMVIRSTVKPHEKSPEEASEDRQLRRPSSASMRGKVVGFGP
jgi:hypothetical protein